MEIRINKARVFPDTSRLVIEGLPFPYSTDLGNQATQMGTVIRSEQPLPCDRRLMSILHESEIEIVMFQTATFARSWANHDSFQIHTTLGDPVHMCGGMVRPT